MWSPDVVFKALSLSMLDSIWQMGLCWIVYLVLTRLLNVSKPRAAFTWGYLFSIIGFSCWGITFYNYLDPPFFNFPLSDGFFLKGYYSTEPFVQFRIFSTLYLAGLSFASLRFIVQYRRLHSLVQSPSTPTPEMLTSFVQKQITQMGISHRIQVKISELTQVPFTYGFWKPVILFPLAALNHLDLYETEAILLHELEHIRRKDYLLNYWIIVLDLVFFFNPFSRAFTASLRQTREQCCDDQVLKNDYPAWQYASALLKLAENENSPSPLWMLGALSPSSPLLQKRIERFIRPSASSAIPFSI
ncbi:MAG: M56 family metallopeptidase, partial [Chitinophagaceae bacterium]